LVFTILEDVAFLFYFDIIGEIGIEPGFNGKKMNLILYRNASSPFRVLLIQKKRNVNG
jgi:hypothetical protein